MVPVWTTLSLLSLLVATVLIGMNRSPALRHVAARWRLLSLTSLVFFLPGVAFLLSWQPTPGPYTVGQTYPFGSALQTWQVTVGFDWVAFATLFAASAMVTSQIKLRWFRVALLMRAAMIWLPHIFIGVAFMLHR